MYARMEGELLSQMVDAVGVGVGAYDAEGRYTYVNRAYAEMLGADRESIVGTAVWEINDGFDQERFDEYWASYDDGETRRAEAVHRYGDHTVEVQTITTRISTDRGAYNVGTIQDITLLKTRERQLSKLHTVTKELIDAGTDEEIARIVAETVEDILDYEYHVVRLAADGERLEPVAVSRSAKKDIGGSWEYDLEESAAAVRAYWQAEPIVVDDVDSLSDGYDRGDARSVLYLPIGPFGVLSIAHPETDAFDDTDVDLAMILASNAEAALERLRNERNLQRQNERLEAFVDAISHDIPNHLNVAASRLELANRQGDLQHLDPVQTAHDRIESLIEDMRALVDHGDRIEETEWLRVDDVLPACWRTCRPEDVDIDFEIADGGQVRADPSRFKQLFENLFWNALEHAEDASWIRFGLLPDGFYVEDDGPGIPETERTRVFDPGYTTTEAKKHSGFGLAIVREIVRAHGWGIDVTESEAGGARFEITGVNVRRTDADGDGNAATQ
jgi:PAS domain S-box-containing protein